MEKNDVKTNKQQSVTKRSPLFKKRNANKGQKAVKFLADFSTMIPGLVESLSIDTQYVVDVSSEIGKKLADGSLQLMQKSTGETLAIVRDSKSKQIVQQLPIKTELVGPMLGPAMLAVGLYVEMKKIEKGIDDLNKGIGEILQNFENDRYARAFAAKEKFEQAVLFTDDKLKQDYLLTILSDVTNTKHMLYKQLTDKVEKLINNKSLLNNKSNVELANQTLQNLYLFNESFKIQIKCYSELEQHYSLSHALDIYENEINTVLTKEVQLAVDGHFKESTNPFSHAITEVITSVYQTNNFLSDNENLILGRSNNQFTGYLSQTEQEILNTYG